MKIKFTYVRALAAACLVSVFLQGPAFGGWEVRAVRLDGVPDEIFLKKRGKGLTKVRVKSKGIWQSLSICHVKLCATPARRQIASTNPPRGGLPDGKVSQGKNDIMKAWLSQPTRRYGHANLGDGIEAEGLVVVDKLAKKYKFSLPLNEVFEDRYARIVDLDGDKSDEVVVVLTSQVRGASLAIFKLTGEGVTKVAQTPPLGVKGSWLNPVGIGDFDGDGKTELAFVSNPDFGGKLEIWEYAKGKLEPEMSLRGFSNHVAGSKVLNMSVVADFDGDGRLDLALPSGDRKSLRIISLAGGMVAEPANLRLPGSVVTEMVKIKIGGKTGIVMGLDSGIVVLVTNNSVSSSRDELPSWYKKNNETSLLQGLVKRNKQRRNSVLSQPRPTYGKPLR